MTGEQRRRIVRLIGDGVPSGRVAAMVGVSRAEVNRVMREHARRRDGRT